MIINYRPRQSVVIEGFIVYKTIDLSQIKGMKSDLLQFLIAVTYSYYS
jgi:hypothetical protein